MDSFFSCNNNNKNIKLSLLPVLHFILHVVIHWFMLAKDSNPQQFRPYIKEWNLILSV